MSAFFRFSRPMAALSMLISLGCSPTDPNPAAAGSGGNGGAGNGVGGEGGGGGNGAAPPYAFRAGSSGFEVSVHGDAWRPFWPIGVNYGHGIPGTFPGEFLATREEIAGFIQAMGDLGANSVRVYTVQSPLFYEELRKYNEAHPDKPLFLLQGAWLPEPAESPSFNGENTYLSSWIDAWFTDELEKIVDVVHGNREIPEGSPDNPDNYGRAFGTYSADVSPWLMGWLIGREMEPLTIRSTHELHYQENCNGMPCTVDFQGEYFSITGGTPTEAFITKKLDYIAAYEEKRYATKRPLGFSSWPTLDTIDHLVDTGYPDLTDDMETIDLRKTSVAETFDPGLFFSYHAYPYYPEFVLHEPSFQVNDEVGPNSYLGYLEKLRSEYAGYTLLIAEIGLPSSQGSAHFTKSGLTHGGLDEVEQGAAILRSLRTITRTNMNGAFLFELIDEWWKRTWVVERLELPASRRHLWYNPMSPEQNFGLIAIRPGLEEKHHLLDGVGDDFPAQPQISQDSAILAPLDVHDASRTLRALTIDSDEGFLHVLLQVDALDPDGNGSVDWDKTDYLIGFDTFDPNRGDRCLDPTCVISSERRIEFLLRIDAENDVALYVDQPYDLTGIWHAYRERWQLYRTEANEDGLFNIVRWITNDDFWYNGMLLTPIIYQETGRFKTGTEDSSSNSNFWYSQAAGTLEIRIPWTLLNVTDPSQRMIVDDYVPGPKNNNVELQISQTPEMGVFVAALGGTGEQENTLVDTLPRAKKIAKSWVIPAASTPTYTWATWDASPQYRSYRKKSFGIVEQALPSIIPESVRIMP